MVATYGDMMNINAGRAASTMPWRKLADKLG